ncbi:MAG: T9SS C-terminal target domain-containing protein [Bacteroidetes bacterium]|nr:MAG: T9SS C-terminal target domain-containing protein [Bacteroidota bacterium]REK06041.1 MAG: T9SS C-terminal target domain-containing protein [Bacteroidota bacterium]REK37099.1 MAG: T9SS C-terminal target domain-containing protein [Bacteroidota bacterium]REK47508.1 MAG: T9SS C-terminal target domain-containing protein [Bacteroidota bacterium]
MNTALPRILLCLIFTVFFNRVSSQVLINELCPSNVTVIQNSNGKYDDWIELYNNGGSSVNMSGYGLTDDISKPHRFMFPSFTLGAGQRTLIFASDSNSTDIVHHWEMSVNALSSWKYAVGSASIDTNWRNLTFNESPWASGNGGIGFGDGDDGTVISSSSISVFMRKSFNIPDTSQILKCVFYMDYDDGFVAYLNGVEIARKNMGNSGNRPAWNVLATGSHEALMYQGQLPDSFFIPPSVLKSIIRNGNNVLAIQTHNNSASSSDLSSIPYLFFGMKNTGLTFANPPSWFRAPAKDYFNAKFKLSRTGETVYLTNAAGTVLDQKTYTTMDMDHSFGRKPDGSSTWCHFNLPTPDATNNSSVCYLGYASSPVFSVGGGWYPSARTITLTTTTPGGVIRYSTNGDAPVASSTQYTSALNVNSTKTLRARVFASGYLPSPVITNTYFINENVKLPVFTITTDSLNLWDYNTGIYVMGPNAEPNSPYKGANFWQNWEKPAAIEYYDKGKNRITRFDAEIEIYGNYSRAKPQKSFEIKLSDRFGTSEINYPFFPDKPFIDKHDNLILRNSGTDWNVVHFRDALMERIMKNTYSGYLATEPCAMYLNGEFWGVYTIHENHDDNWMKNNFGLKKSEIDYLKEDGSTITVKEGSDASYWTMYNYATVQNPNTQQYYDYMNSVLDLQNFTDYFIAQTYYNNGDWIGDWTNNIKMWRPNAPGSKWRYLLYDTDFGFGLKGSVNDNRLEIARNPAAFSHSSELFDAILKNPTYQRYFINRYADLINTIYLPANVSPQMMHFRDSMANDMPAHFAKWGSNTTTWQNNINSMMNFVSSRPSIMRNYIRSGFSLTSQVTLTLQTSPPGSGRIEISTITPSSYPWSGVYFNGNPVTITAIPNPGYTFSHWRSNVAIPSNNPNQSATFNFTANDAITAYFTGSAVAPQLTFNEINYNSDGAMNSGDWVELYNYGTVALDISGWKFRDEEDHHTFKFPTGTVIPAGGFLVLIEDTAAFRQRYPSVTNKIGPIGFNLSNGGEEIRLFDHNDNLYLSMTYQDVHPWPLGADGGGYTLELSSPTANLNDGNSWFAGCLGGSPGRAYSPLLSTPVNVAGNTTFCSPGSVNLSVTHTAGYSYQWLKNGSNIPGATSNSYSATSAGAYSVAISNAGCSMVSDPVNVTVVTQAPNPVTQSASRCDAGAITLYANATDSIFWYDAPGGNLLAIGDSLVIPNLSSTTTYYAVASRICPSNAVSATATINAVSTQPSTNDVTRCGPGSVTLSATHAEPMRWYNASVGGAVLHTGGTYTTNILNNDTIFYVEAGTVCPSSRVPVTVNISSTPAPVTMGATRCGNGTLTLTASSAYSITWFNTANGGSSIGSGSSFTTPVLSVTDTFYAQATNICPSVRTATEAIVNYAPATPTASDSTRCGPGVLQLRASSSEQVYWYDSSTGGTLLHTGSVFTTPSLISTTTFYAEAGYNCRTSRIPVQAIIASAPSAPVGTPGSRCGTGIVNISATSPELVTWYSSASGGTALATGSSFTTPSISTTTSYYAEAGTVCRSNRTAVQAVINAVPSAPVPNSASRCGPGTVTLTATSPEQVYWFDAPSGGNLLATGLSFTTPSISATTTYYIEAGNTCRSARVSITATVNNAPSLPSASNVSRCGNGTVTLTATATDPVFWYSVPSGGTQIGSGSSFTTPVLSSTTTYYVETNNGCSSSSRVSVQAIINPLPAAPSAADSSRCGPGSVTLAASSADPVAWFSSASGGTALASGYVFVTPSISTSTTYYAEAGTTCKSLRTAVRALINAPPSAPVTSDVTRCGPGSVTLNASSPEQIQWFAGSSGGPVLHTGPSFVTPFSSVTESYYAEAGTSCKSTRSRALAIIQTIPAVPAVTGGSRCGPGSVLLGATSPEQINWYDAPSGGTLLGTGSSFNTPVITGTTMFYANAGTDCYSARVAVNAVIVPLPQSPVTTSDSRCDSGVIVLTASSPEQIYWYDAPTGGNLLDTGTVFTTPLITSSMVYYVEAGDSCRSNRVQANAIIIPTSQPPVVSNVSNCGPGSVMLHAVSPDSVTWYDQVNGSLVGSGSNYLTPILTQSEKYFAIAGIECPSTPALVEVFILALPTVDIGPDTIDIISGQNIILDAGQGFLGYQWSTGDSTQSIVVNGPGNYVVTVTDSNGCFGSDIIHVRVSVSLEEPNLNFFAVLYPNPAHDFFTVIWPDNHSGKVLMKMYSALGKLIFSEELSGLSQDSSAEVSLKYLAPGVYYIKLESDMGSQTLRLVKQ